MRVLILGVSGMLGHKLWQVCRDRFETWATVRSSYQEYATYGIFESERLLGKVDVRNFDTVVRTLETVQPNVIINTVGIIKQLPAAHDPIISLEVNSLFPHRLARLCQASNTKMIHVSTDCVFSGRKGMYVEDDAPDADDLYGRSKLLGEVSGSNCLTVRTSLIGRELKTAHGLVEWFLSNQDGSVRGYTNAIFSGFPTLILGDIITNVIKRHPDLSGVYHVSSEPISKFQLLCMLRDAYQIPVEIEPFPNISIDRSLDSSRFLAATGYQPPPWQEMIRTMVNDPTPYEEWRKLSDSSR